MYVDPPPVYVLLSPNPDLLPQMKIEFIAPTFFEGLLVILDLTF